MSPRRLINKAWASLRGYVKNAHTVLSMNARNLHYIYPNNRREDYLLADNKLLTKEKLAPLGVRIPKTLHVFDSFFHLAHLEQVLEMHREFVIKPASGSGGGGIVVIVGRNEQGWIDAGGGVHTVHSLRRHIGDILFGVYSFGLTDAVIVEERLVQHPLLTELGGVGLADIRVILLRDEPLMGMLRVPTARSRGRANLHQGAIGLGIDLTSGHTTQALLLDQFISHHPDTGALLGGFQIPFWSEVMATARLAASALPLKYIGADVAITEHGPTLLEVNVRPGLQIQNANGRGLRRVIDGTNR